MHPDPSHSLLPPILPARTIHTALRLNTPWSENQTLKLQKREKKESKAYLLTDPLPAKLALDRMLDDRVARRPPVDKRNGIQRDADADEVEDLVDEVTTSNQSGKERKGQHSPFFETIYHNLRSPSRPARFLPIQEKPKKKNRDKEQEK